MTNLEPNGCPKCGLTIPSEAPFGMCPSCSFRYAFSPEHSPDNLDTYADFGEIVPYEQEGRYEVLGEQGRGAMGRALLVIDKALRRNVVLKEHSVRTPSGTDGSIAELRDERLTRRFLHEARITAQLEHPGIAPVHDLGLRADGTPYYTMKLIPGHTLQDELDRAKTAAERLTLLPRFVDLCHAVAYAHSKGVVHRDIKPSNVMVGDFGETVLLDWGIAKAVDESLDSDGDVARYSGIDVPDATATGELMGSPLFMAPEQVSQDSKKATPQADVYALGVVLYYILTGSTPFEWTTLEDVLHRVESETPPKLEQRVPDAPAELIAICERAMARDIGRRYSSAKELTDDLLRYQSGAIVDAYQYEARDLFTRFVRRHRGRILAGVSTLLLVTLVSSVFAAQLYRNNQELASANIAALSARDDARQNAALAEQNAANAERQHQAAEAANQALVLAKEKADHEKVRAEDALATAQAAQQETMKARDAEVGARAFAEKQRDLALRALDRLTYDVPESLRGIPEAREKVIAILQENVELLDKFDDDPQSPSTVTEQEVANYSGIGERWHILGDTSASVQAHQQALRLARDVATDAPLGSDPVRKLVNVYFNLIEASLDDSDYSLTASALDEVDAIIDRHCKVQEFESSWQLPKANALRLRSQLLNSTGQFPSTQKELALARSAVDAYCLAFPADDTAVVEKGLIETLTAAIAWRRGRYDEAKIHIQRSRKLVEPIAAQKPDDVALALIVSELWRLEGSVYNSYSQYERALATFKLEQESLQTISQHRRTDFKVLYATAANYSQQATNYRLLGDYESAADYFEKAMAIAHDLLLVESPGIRVRRFVAWLHNDIAELHRSRGDFKQALVNFETARDMLVELFKDSRENAAIKFELAHVYNNIGSLHREFEIFDVAERNFDLSLELWQELGQVDPDSYTVLEHQALAHNSIGLIRNSRGSKDEAMESLSIAFRQEAACISKGHFRGISLDYINNTYLLLSPLCAQAGRIDEWRALQLAYLDVLHVVADDDPINRDGLEAYARHCDSVSRAMMRANIPDVAKTVGEDAVRTWKSLVELEPANANYQEGLARAVKRLNG